MVTLHFELKELHKLSSGITSSCCFFYEKKVFNCLFQFWKEKKGNRERKKNATSSLGRIPTHLNLKARFSRFKSRLFLRVSTQAEKKRDLNREKYFLRVSTQALKNRDPNRTVRAMPIFLYDDTNTQRMARMTGRTERPPCMMGYKKPVRFSFTILSHRNSCDYLKIYYCFATSFSQKDALLVVTRILRSESHSGITSLTVLSPQKKVALIWVAIQFRERKESDYLSQWEKKHLLTLQQYMKVLVKLLH